MWGSHLWGSLVKADLGVILQSGKELDERFFFFGLCRSKELDNWGLSFVQSVPTSILQT